MVFSISTIAGMFTFKYIGISVYRLSMYFRTVFFSRSLRCVGMLGSFIRSFLIATQAPEMIR